jgi:antitoxin component YwqK of YwqJK toxin-antitoxin module
MVYNKKFLYLFITVFFFFGREILPQLMPLAEKQTDPVKKEKLITQDLREIKKAKLLKVEERTRFLHYNSDGSFSSQKILAEKVYFDKNGNKIEHINLKSDSLLENRQTFQYDSMGHLILTESYNEHDYVVLRRQSSYDEKGREILRIFKEAKSRGESKAEMKYNEDNLLDELITYKPNGKILTIIKMYYDNGRLISFESQNEHGAVVDKSFLKYDNDGNIISETITNNKDSATVYYEYNTDGYVTKIKYPDATRYMEYNSNGDLIEDKQIYHTGETEFKLRFTYYDNGLIKESIRYSSDDKPTFYSVYDYEFYK